MMLNQNIFQKLKTSIPFFRNLTDQELVLLLKSSKREVYTRDSSVFQENTFGDTMYVIVSGMVDIHRKVNGKNQSIVTLSAGNCFGEMGLIDDAPRSASARIISEKAELFSISEGVLKSSGVNILYKLFHGFARILSERLREVNQKYTDISVEEETTMSKLREVVKKNTSKENNPMNGCNFSKSNLSGIFFNKTKMQQSLMLEGNFHGAKIKGSNLEASDFTLSQFAECVIQDCNFQRSNFTAAKFDKVIFRGCSFNETIMKTAGFSKVSMKKDDREDKKAGDQCDNQ